MAEWKKLGEYLMVKYVDGVIKPEVNGEFKKNQYGQYLLKIADLG